MAVTPEKIATALGVDPPQQGSAEFEQWSMWIDDAKMLIESRLGSIINLDQNKVEYVIREAVVRHIKHPDDATQVQVSVDDASTMKSYSSSTGRVVILDEWWELLSPKKEGGGAFVIDTAPTSSAHLPWCAYSLGAAYCSCGVDIAGYPIYEVS